MSEDDLLKLTARPGIAPWRIQLARWVESRPVQHFIIAVILLNAAVLGLETDAGIMARWGGILITIDRLCLVIFCSELILKFAAYRRHFWRSNWNLFDFAVVAIALVPGAGPWAVLRSLRVLRVLRLLTAIPSLRKVVAAFLRSIPGLGGVMAVMTIFFYTMAVLATRLFGENFPDRFGSLGKSLYTLFEIMTLDSWSTGTVRTIMEVHPWAWAFFFPFIIIATFTILNLFIGIIVSTMQELSVLPEEKNSDPELTQLLARMDEDLKSLRLLIEKSEARQRDDTPR